MSIKGMGLPVYLSCSICRCDNKEDLRVCSIHNEPHCVKCHNKLSPALELFLSTI